MRGFHRAALILPLILGLAGAIHSPAARAFETLGMSWRTGRVNYRINPNFPDQDLSGTREQQVELISCSAESWREQSVADLRFVYLGTTTATGLNDNDGINTVSWSDQAGGDALAVTLISGVGSRIEGFDMVLFSESLGTANEWSGPQDPPSGTMDIRGIAAHEFGHAIGLDHSGIRTSTMYAAALNRGQHLRTLHEDDLAGVEFLYDTRAGASPAASILEVEPSSGPAAGRNEVLIRGRNFTWDQNSTLYAGGRRLSSSAWTIEDCCLIRVHRMISGNAGAADIRLTSELGDVVLEDGYRYLSPAPELAAISPGEGPVTGGIPVTVTGENFSSAAEVRIGGVELEDPVWIDSRMIRGSLPRRRSGGIFDVTVAQDGTLARLQDAFNYRSKVLRVAESEGPIGGNRIPVDILCTSDEALTGVSFAVSYETSELTMNEISTENLLTNEASFAAANIDNESGITTFGIVMSLTDTTPSIPAAEELVIARLLVSMSAELSVGDRARVELTSGIGSPPVELEYTTVAKGRVVSPLAMHGQVTALAAATFLRGDSDQNGTIQLTDAVFLLDYLFRGGRVLSCEDAADSNDDGRIDISDGILILRFLFSGGDRPRMPFPRAGMDPTDDDLGC